MNPMAEWSYPTPWADQEDDEYLGTFIQEDAQNAIEYGILDKHGNPPHSVRLLYGANGSIYLRCVYCGMNLLEWERPEKED